MSEIKKKQKEENWSFIKLVMKHGPGKREEMARITIDKIIGQIKKADADIKALNETKKLYRDLLRQLKKVLKEAMKWK